MNTKAICIGIDYIKFEDLKLSACALDCSRFINNLINKQNYLIENITVFSDVPNTFNQTYNQDINFTIDPNQIIFPTRTNILDALNNTSDIDLLYLYYSGHGTNGENEIPNKKESDGKDEHIIVYDDTTEYIELIIDDDLRKCINSMNSKSIVYAFFDCCNSGSLLDTEVLLGHKQITPLSLISMNADFESTIMISGVLLHFLYTIYKSYKNDEITYALIQNIILYFLAFRLNKKYINLNFINVLYNLQNINQLNVISEPTIYCVSAARDSELAYETENGGYFTNALIQYLETNQMDNLFSTLNQYQSFLNYFYNLRSFQNVTVTCNKIIFFNDQNFN